jgi:hypothetical protein
MREAGADVLRGAVNAVNAGAQELWRAKREVEAIAITARSAEAQRQALLWASGVGIAAGLILFPLLGAFAPGGSYLGALATGNAELAGWGFAHSGGKSGACGGVGRVVATCERER